MQIAARQSFLTGRAGPPLPYDAEVEYLESGGSQYVDTGILLSATDVITCDFMLTNGTYSAIFGAGNADGAAGVSHSVYLQNRNTLQFQCTSAPGATASYSINTRYLFVGDIGARTMTINGGSVISAGNSVLDSMARSLYIFCRNLNGMADRKSRMRLYAFAVAGKRDYIAVRVGTSGYLYDKANPTGGPLGNGLYGNAADGQGGVTGFAQFGADK